jgi:hypothetical protein
MLAPTRQDLIRTKIRRLRDEGYPQNQAVAMAIAMVDAGRVTPEGDYIPVRRNGERVPLDPNLYMLGGFPSTWERFANKHPGVVAQAIEAGKPVWWIFAPSDIREDTARTAYSGISFREEIRGVQVRADFATSLNADVRTTLKAAQGIPEAQQAALDVWREAKPRIVSAFVAYLSAKGRTTSWVITGRSGRDARREQKKMDTERNRYEDFKKLVARVMKDASDVAASAVVAARGGPKAVADQELDALLAEQARMKEANKIARSTKLTPEEKIAKLGELGIRPTLARELVSPPYAYMKQGYQSYSMTSINEKIKRRKAKIEEEAAREAKAVQATAGELPTEWKFDGTKGDIPVSGTVYYDYDDDRLRIVFDERLTREDFQAMKSRGFRWARTYGAFSRHLRESGVYAARAVTGLDLPFV